MFVFEYITGPQAIAGIVGTLIILGLMIRKGGVAGWLDPLLMPIFQVTLTVLLLGWRIIPLPDVIACILFLIALSLGRGTPSPISRRHTTEWRQLTGILLPLSIAANAYLISQKGMLIFQDDVGSARQEFYQGWGPFKRLNIICAVLFAVRWAEDLLAGRAMRLAPALTLLWAMYLTLTIGSKSGILLILTSVGAAQIYTRTAISTRALFALCLSVGFGVAAMFMIIYPDEALARFGIRVISYVDGPFYYFLLPNPPTVSLGYSFDQLLVALRIYDQIPQTSLGPAINLEYLSYDNELVGPNPQIFVEARAIAGLLWPLYYVALAAIIIMAIRRTRTAYGYALVALIIGPLIIDSQLALSNALNVALAFLLKIGVSLVPRVRNRNAKSRPIRRLSRI